MTHNLRAIVLWTRRSRDADKIVGLFSRQMGRLTVRATSAARATAKFAALTEPFVESDVAVHLRPGQVWGKLVGGQMIRSFPQLRTQMDRSIAASWVCEIMHRLTPEEQASPEKYDLLSETLEAMETAAQFGVLRLAFAIRFLALAGFGVENRQPWIDLQERFPERALGLVDAPLESFCESRWPEPTIKALEQLAGTIVSDHLNRPLHVNRFRQMTGIEI